MISKKLLILKKNNSKLISEIYKKKSIKKIISSKNFKLTFKSKINKSEPAILRSNFSKPMKNNSEDNSGKTL